MSMNMNISEAELEIMKVLWEHGGEVSTQVINRSVADKNWKRTTVSTFLARLTQKGAISCEKRGNIYYYTPLISAKKYRKMQTGNLIKSLYNGSVKDFAVALFEEEALSGEDIKELKSIIDGMEG